VEGYGPSTYGDRFADVYDDWYADVSDVAACVERVASLAAQAGGGPVLELGVGSGRLAVPLAARGLEVMGVDASAAMLERLRNRPGGDAVRVVNADMAGAEALVSLPRPAVVLLAFNTLFNLPSQDAQQRCLATVARRLRPGGCVLVEAFVPRAGEDLDTTVTKAVEPRRIALDEVVLTVSEVDHRAQTVTGQHVQLTEQGIRLRPWHLRFATPDQLDTMAARAGLALRWRHGGWAGEPFDDQATVGVSCYEQASEQASGRTPGQPRGQAPGPAPG
jgi:SAM-dependent methyltransferase